MSLMEQCKTVALKEFGDERGKMIVVEGGQAVPFEIKRLFYIYGASAEAVRGQHANKYSSFAMFCVAGSCKVRVTDGTEETVVTLDRPDTGLYIPRLLWKDMYDFSPDCVLLVLADTHYDGNEYFRDFEEYKNMMTKENEK